jgi:hypothetical protein
MNPKVVEELVAKRDELIELMVALVRPQMMERPEDERRQLITGFVHLVEAAARGDLRPRDEYLEMVIPGTKAHGFGQGDVVGMMVQTSMALAAVISRESLPWCVQFCRDYTVKLIAIWRTA